MRLGLVPLSLAVAVSATRLLGLLYLTVATVSARRGAELKVAQRA
jgi:hypothetical protein